MFFHSVVYTIYIIYASDVKSAHTHVNCFIWGCKVFVFRGEGRGYGVNKFIWSHWNHLNLVFYIYFTSYLSWYELFYYTYSWKWFALDLKLDFNNKRKSIRGIEWVRSHQYHIPNYIVIIIDINPVFLMYPAIKNTYLHKVICILSERVSFNINYRGIIYVLYNRLK